MDATPKRGMVAVGSGLIDLGRILKERDKAGGWHRIVDDSNRLQ